MASVRTCCFEADFLDYGILQNRLRNHLQFYEKHFGPDKQLDIVLAHVTKFAVRMKDVIAPILSRDVLFEMGLSFVPKVESRLVPNSDPATA